LDCHVAVLAVVFGNDAHSTLIENPARLASLGSFLASPMPVSISLRALFIK
jgi:hypothetical protein